MKTICSFVAIFAYLAIPFVAEKAIANHYVPQGLFILERKGYTLAYDGRTRNACWVYEFLTAESLKNEGGVRKRIRFKEDLSLPKPVRAVDADFRGSGFDRGHLCPHGDVSGSPEDSFLLSNASPQVPEFNQGQWNRLENYLRKLALKFKALHVFTIPLYLPEKCGEKKFVRYETIGQNQVAVPTHFCKVIYAEGEKGVELFVYVLPNSALSRDAPLELFRTTLDKVERLSGLIFPIH